MHDHSHDHDHSEGEHDHDFGPLTTHEQTLFHRSQVMHVATEIFKSGVPRKGWTAERQPYFTPAEAVATACDLIAAVDQKIHSCRIEDDQSS